MSNIGLSVIIPSKTEVYLDNTILDILKNAVGNIEVIVILDGYDTKRIEDDRVRYFQLEASSSNQKRKGINLGVANSKYDFIAASDAHCSFDKGFDKVLIDNSEYNKVQVPRRNRLDAENWCIQDQKGRPPIDYEYPMWNSLLNDHGVHGYKWQSRAIERKDILEDEIFMMQASFWFMPKSWFNYCGFMSPEGYGGWGAESEQIIFETYQKGGKVVVQKRTWYSHLHKGRKYTRMYKMNDKERRASYAYSYNKWVIENKEFFVALINHFMPIPKFPVDWEYQIYNKK